MANKPILVYDIETDSLLIDATTVWVLGVKDIRSGKRKAFYKGSKDGSIEDGLDYLNEAELRIGHNVVMFDDPVLERLYPKHKLVTPVYDTLTASRLLYADPQTIPAFRKGLTPDHTLATWGKYLGVPKKEHTDFTKLSKDMIVYCLSDLDVCHAIYNYVEPRTNRFPMALKIEHKVYSIIAKQIDNGVGFDEAAAKRLVAKLSKRKIELDNEIQSNPKFKPKRVEYVTPKKQEKKVRLVEFNPGSRDQIRDYLFAKGWKPKKFTKPSKSFPEGQAALDDDVLEILTLKYPELKPVHERFTVTKRLAQVATGEKNWFDAVNKRTGRIHGNVIPNGTVTGRMAHSDPNLGQVPRITNPYGPECRACFLPTPRWYLFGGDASSLEGRILAHYLFRWDGGKYRDIITQKDIHTFNMELLGLKDRDTTKTVYYAYNFGASDEKLGFIVGKDAKYGAWMRKQLEQGIEGLSDLKAWLESELRKNKGYIFGLDGRPLYARRNSLAVNLVCQSGGAVVMKVALALHYQQAVALYGEPKTQANPRSSWGYCLNVHDEFQGEAKDKKQADKLGSLIVSSITKSGELLKLNCPLTGAYKVGKNWSETH